MLPTELGSDTGKSLAVVGAGPAGLACAFYARLEGHAVTVFEALPKPGGVLRYGIPRSRLPGEVLDQELSVLWRMGIRASERNASRCRPCARRSHESIRRGFPGAGRPGLLPAGNRRRTRGGRFRHQHQVHRLRPVRSKMPGELYLGRQEATPRHRFDGMHQMRHVPPGLQVRCCRRGGRCGFGLRWGRSGRNSRRQMRSRRGRGGGTTTHADERTFQTDDPRVFAGGDGAFGAQTVVDAVAQGKRAAWAIDAYLRGYDLRDVARRLAELQATPFYTALAAARDLDPRIERLAGIKPVFLDMAIAASPLEHKSPSLSGGVASGQAERGLTEAQARTEAGMCLDCYCPANGDCELQRYGIEYGVFKNRFKGQCGPRLPGRLPPRLHHARAQPLHHVPALRARLPHGGRGELLRRHGPRLGHDRLDARQPAPADGRLRLVRQVRRDLPHRLHRDQPAHPRPATTWTRAAASSAASASRSAPTTRSSRPASSSSPATAARCWPASRSTCPRQRPATVAARVASPTSCPTSATPIAGAAGSGTPVKGDARLARRDGARPLMPHGDFHPGPVRDRRRLGAGLRPRRRGLQQHHPFGVAMVLCFLGVAFAYALLDAGLLAIIQILVYVGAISIVVIFAIMLTELQPRRSWTCSSTARRPSPLPLRWSAPPSCSPSCS